MTGLCGRFDVDAVVVDLDGTMVDTLGDFWVALNRMLADLPPPFADQQIDQVAVARLIGKGSEHLVKSVLALVYSSYIAINKEANRLSPEELDGFYQQAWPVYQSHYRTVNGQHAVVYPGVLDGLTYLKSRGLKLACLTNKPTELAVTLLGAKGLGEFFERTFGGDAFARKKPDPLPLLKTCEALVSSPGRTLMIGDSSNDALAARAAGCPMVLVTYGYNHGQPIRAVDADGYIDSMQNLALA